MSLLAASRGAHRRPRSSTLAVLARARAAWVVAIAGLVVGASAAPAAADKASVAAVDKLVRTHIAASLGPEQRFLATLTPDAHITRPDGSADSADAYPCVDDPEQCDTSESWYEHVTQIYGRFRYTLIGKPAIYVDDASHVASFQAVARLTVDGSLGEELQFDAKGKTTMRITGIAVVAQGRWKIAAVAHTPSMSDQALAGWPDTGARTRHAPGSPVAAEVLSWVGHLADHVSPHAIGAAGTAPRDAATKPEAIAALARSWDQLPIDVTYLQAVPRGDTVLLWGTATRTIGTKTYALVPIIIVERDGASWRWIAITWGPRGLFEASLAK